LAGTPVFLTEVSVGFLCPQANASIVQEVRPQSLPSISLQIHYPLTAVSFGAIDVVIKQNTKNKNSPFKQLKEVLYRLVCLFSAHVIIFHIFSFYYKIYKPECDRDFHLLERVTEKQSLTLMELGPS
jgi:hypothetical protein